MVLPTFQSLLQNVLFIPWMSRVLMYCFDRTKSFRKRQQLFVSFSKPHSGMLFLKQGLHAGLLNAYSSVSPKQKRQLPVPPRPHSTRKKGASMIFLDNIPLADISKTATWSTPHIFTKHYYADILACQQGIVCQTVLHTLFYSATSSG